MPSATKLLTILVIGGNRGIGFELVKGLLDRRHRVLATYRPLSAKDESIAQLADTGAQLLELDFEDEASIIAAATQLETRNQSLDVLINSGGVYKLWDEKSFTEMDASDLIWHFKVNTIGPFLTSKHFLPALAKSERGRVINISSDMGSIEDNVTGGNLPYRVSKTALNQFTRTAAEDLKRMGKNVKTIAVHPGFLSTKMTGFQGEDNMDESVQGIIRIVENFGVDDTEENANMTNGGYVRWNGEKMKF